MINQPSLKGLTTAEAERRHREFGPNEIVRSSFAGQWDEFKKIIMDPMGLMLLALAGLYALMGNHNDALVVLMAYIPITAVDVLLDIRAHRALRALRQTLKVTAKVLRDGVIREVPIKTIVVGDVLAFEEGQTLPADGKVLEAKQLTINEAALTGESVPLEKSEDSLFFGGTTILHGGGFGEVETIGKATQFGKIASLMEDTEAEQSPLQKRVHFLVRRILIGALLLVILLFGLQFTRTGDFVPSLIVALTFGMAAVPEEFPLVFTLYLSLGAWRLTKHGVLVKSLPSVEALGSVDVICTDKTGTLTEGRFKLEGIHALHPDYSEELLWQSSLMACEEKPIDAMELAIVEGGQSFVYLMNGWRLIWDYPFEPKGKHMTHVWENASGESRVVMKGAIEGVMEHCALDATQTANLLSLTDTLANEGKRLMGLAYGVRRSTGDRTRDEKDLIFIGIIAFNDPLRSSVKAAVKSCQEAGIAIKMLTGDHPLTAHAIAEEAGIEHCHDFLFTGSQLAAMSRESRWDAYQKGAIFSRVLPEQKHEMVQALKSTGQVVAMTGDGINDAPALKLADIGISMGRHATDVARSTAQMILMRNDFSGVVAAVFEGRRIFANLRRSFAYLVAFHIPIVLLAFATPTLGWGDLLMPIHIILLELIVHPVSAFSFENLPVESTGRERSLLPRSRFMEAALAGVLLSLFSLILFHSLQAQGEPIETARAIALSTVLWGNMGFVILESWPVWPSRIVNTLIGLTGLIFLIFGWSYTRSIFHLGPIDAMGVFTSATLGLGASIPSMLWHRFRSHTRSR